MRLLSDDELRAVQPSETAAFPGPIPTQSVSSDEFIVPSRGWPSRGCPSRGCPSRG
jgi:hypothetical protein